MLDIRRRTGYLFLAVVLGQVILISAQVNSRAGVPLLEAMHFGLPVVAGARETKKQMLLYTLVLWPVALAPTMSVPTRATVTGPP